MVATEGIYKLGDQKYSEMPLDSSDCPALNEQVPPGEHRPTD